MKRHPSLVPLSHDHHHGLVHARRLRSAAAGEGGTRASAAAEFLRFFAAETLRHFRDEEETIFPLLVDHAESPPELLGQVLLEHQRIHALVARLDDALSDGEAPAELMREVGETLESHIRREERSLFPLIEEVVSDEALDRVDLTAAQSEPNGPVISLTATRGRGPVWGTASEDLNVTLLAWNADEGPPEHVNTECDVFVLVLAGTASVVLDGHAHAAQAGDAVMIDRGCARRIVAGPGGVRYVAVHRRRPPLAIASSPPDRAPRDRR